MKTDYQQFLESDEVASFVRRKYKQDRTIRQMLLSDPYYRFVRILGLLKKTGIRVEPGDSWLDVGCHHGQFIHLTKTEFECRFVGMDDWELKKEMPFVQFEYHPVDLAKDDWPSLVSGKQKVVSALEVIEHMVDTEKFLRNIREVLVDDGYLVISTPNISSLRNRMTVPFGAYPAYLEYKNVIHHVRLFNKTKLVQFLADHGFETLKCIGVNFLPEKLLKLTLVRRLSEIAADTFPGLCGNLVIIARKKSV